MVLVAAAGGICRCVAIARIVGVRQSLIVPDQSLRAAIAMAIFARPLAHLGP